MACEGAYDNQMVGLLKVILPGINYTKAGADRPPYPTPTKRLGGLCFRIPLPEKICDAPKILKWKTDLAQFWLDALVVIREGRKTKVRTKQAVNQCGHN
jgi:hypothetical protein